MNVKSTNSRRKFLFNSAISALGVFATGLTVRGADEWGKGPLAPDGTFYVIPHTHWEGAVFATREAYLKMGHPHIITALSLLKRYPEYTFVLDQVNYVKPFLERYESESLEFREFVKQGRLQIVGAMDSMHDNNMPSAESIVRQYLYGKHYYRKELGVDVKTGWALDTFGHNAQMPQILRLAGFDSVWFQRGVPRQDFPTEFLWKSLDGTPIDAIWLAQSYVNLSRVPETEKEFTTFVEREFNELTPNMEGEKNRVGLAGMDVQNPQEVLPELVRAYNKNSSRQFDLKFSVPTAYEAIVRKRTNRQTYSGELNPVFQGIYSSRIELKQKLRDVETILTAAEKTAALNEIFGRKTDNSLIWKAWEPTLFNQAHDLMSGVMTDHVYADTVRGYEYAEQLGKELLEENLDYFSDQINTTGDGVAVIVFNSLGLVRDDVAEADIAFLETGMNSIILTDDTGAEIPVEIMYQEKYDDGSIRTARILFVAKQVPSLGYRLYRVKGKKEKTAELKQDVPEDQIENEFWRIRIDLMSGAISSVFDKALQWEVLKAPANVVSRQYDGGDFWELYHNLTGGMVQNTAKQTVPTTEKERLSNQRLYRGQKGTIRRGPVYSEFSVSHGFGAANKFSTRVRLYAGIKRIDIYTTLYNTEKFVRYQVMFPTSIQNGKIMHEIPFGAFERPEAMEFPAQNWADYSDATKGLAVLNRGLPGNITSNSTMMVSLMRSAKIDDYPYFGGYEPWMTSDTGLQLNKTMEFNYALLPHKGGWQEADLAFAGLSFNNPLICRKEEPHAGKLASKWNLLEISDPAVILTSVKPGADGTTIVRLYEATGNAKQAVSLKFNRPVKEISEVNLIEDPIAKLKATGNNLTFALRGFEIKTFRVSWKA